MAVNYPSESEPAVKRVLWLYGLYMLLSNASYLIGYYLLPEGFLRGSPATAAGRLVAQAPSFWSEFALTLLFNIGLVIVIALIMNLNQVRGFPVGYLYPMFLGVTSGLIAGTNSFVASDLNQFNVRDGMALGLSIGNAEMLGYILVIAATVKYGIYHYKSWWRWGREWRAEKVKRLRDVRLGRDEALLLITGLILVVLAGAQETVLARSGH